MAGYAMALHYFSKYVANRLNKEDPSYFNFDKGDGFEADILSSIKISQMLMDFTIPEEEYSTKLKYLIYTARWIFFLAIPFGLILCLF
ncbi:hypothetical protein B0E48_16155 [Rhodanobacter sp. C03]|nr:hypothetical protein B0E48_16155 [Rhodanobacter sp. C03]